MKFALYTLAAVGMLATGSIAEAGHGCHSYGGYYPTTHYTKSRVIYQDTHVHDQYIQPGYTTLPYGYKGFTHYADLNTYGCKGFFCPQYNDWFYFYPQKNVYLPVNQIQQFAPTVNKNDNDNFNFNDNDNDNFNKNTNQNVTNITIAPGALNTKPIIPVAPGIGPKGPVGDVLPLPVN